MTENPVIEENYLDNGLLKEMIFDSDGGQTTSILHRDLQESDVDPDGIPWYKRTIMGGLSESNHIIDARQVIDGQTNPNFGIKREYTPTSGYIAISNFVPLMGCDKIKMTVQLTTTIGNIANIAGVVGYDIDQQPVAAIHTVILGEQTSFGEIEFDRPTDVEYIRYHTIGGSNFLYNHIQLFYSFVTLRNQLLNEKLLVRKTITLSEDNGDIGPKSVKISNGGYQDSRFNHAVMNVKGTEYVTIRGRILHFDNNNINYGGVILGELQADGTRPKLDEIYRILYLNTNSIGYTFNITFKIPEGADQIRWTIHSSITQLSTYIYRKISTLHNQQNQTPPIDLYTIGQINKKFLYLERIRQAKYIHISESDSKPTILGLFHHSDIHEDTTAGKTIIKYADTYSNLIDDIINTGDVVKNYLDNGNPNSYFNMDSLAARSLFVLGNHDQAIESMRAAHFWTNADGNKATIAETVAASHTFSFQHYFENYLEGWNVVMPSGYDNPNSPYYQACYWHKDYTEQKIRLIGLDCMYRFDGILAKDGNGNFIVDSDGMLSIAVNGNGMAKLTTEQETWFKWLLDETLTTGSNVYGYSVVCLAHYPLEDLPKWNEIDENGCNNKQEDGIYVGGRVINHRTRDVVVFEQGLNNQAVELDDQFNMRNRIVSSSSPGYRKGSVNNIGDIIQHFIDHNGKFVAWICGHTHVDHFYYPRKYPKLLVVSIDQAGALRDHKYAARPDELDMRLCANYYAIDTATGHFKIVRLGLTYDRYLRPKRTICFDYINRKVISEN